MNHCVWAFHFLDLSPARQAHLTFPRNVEKCRGHAGLGVPLLGPSQPPDSLAAEWPGHLTQVVPLYSWKKKHQSKRGGGGKARQEFFQALLLRNEKFAGKRF